MSCSSGSSIYPAHGFEEILSPGEPELRIAKTNHDQGVPLTPDVLESLRVSAQGLALGAFLATVS